MDHSEFIKRHHKFKPEPRARGRAGWIRPWMILLLAAAYLAGCVAVALALDFDVTIVGMIAGLFVGAFFLAFAVQRVLHVFSSQEKERLLLHEVIEGSRGARLITDSADQPIYTNNRFDQICAGIGPPSLSTLVSIFSATPQAAVAFQNLSDQAHRGLTDTIELTLTQQGRDVWWSITAQPVAGWAGYVHWRIDDVTDRYMHERAVREEREKLIDFTDNAPVGFFSVDEQGRFLFVNATLARWLGESIEDLITYGRLHAYFENIPHDAAPYDIMKGGGGRQSAEVRMKGRGGNLFLAAITQTVVNENGIIRTRAVVNDVTAEKEIRQALQASEDRFRKFFEDAPLGIALIGADFTIADSNAALSTLLRVPVAEMTGRNFLDMIHPDDRDSVRDTLTNLAPDVGKMSMEIRLMGFETVVVRLFARQVKDQENRVVHFLDLTQQKTLEAQFVQSQKMQAIGQLAGGIAHDFNNLLTAMIGFCDLLLLRHKPGDPSFGDIQQIKQNSNRAANLVRQLLAFSRQQTLRPEVHDVVDIITELSHLIRRLIGVSIEFSASHATDGGLVKVDIGQMEQVLINLAVNARDAMNDNGRLTIETGILSTAAPLERGADIMPPGDWVTIAVTDTGCGMPPEIMARIFEPFFTTKDVGQGTGLGLATVYGIMRQTGGYIHVDSRVNDGTTFTLYLPRASADEVARAEQVSQAVEEVKDLTGTARIMLVEDEDAVRTFSHRALTNKGYEVMMAENGRAALDVLAGYSGPPIDLLVTDVMMPEMDGPTLARTLREQRPDLKIIFMSGYTEERLKDYMAPGIFFLPKPFSLRQLAEKVKEVLDS